MRAAYSLVKRKLGMPSLNEVKFGCQSTTSNRFVSISVCNCRYTALTIHIGTVDVQRWVQSHECCQNLRLYLSLPPMPPYSMQTLKFSFRQQTAQDHVMQQLWNMLCTNTDTFWVALDFLSEVLDVPDNDVGPADHSHSPAVPYSTPSNGHWKWCTSPGDWHNQRGMKRAPWSQVTLESPFPTE